MKNEGRGDKLLAISDVFATRAANGEWNNQLDANFAINCNDEQRRTPDEEAELRREIMEVSPFIDTGRSVDGVSRDACESWPVEPTLGIPYATDVEDVPETLIISITGDPVTPYEGGQSLAESLGGNLLTVHGERHTVAQAGINECVNAIAADYLIDLETPNEGQTCSL